MRAIRMSGFKDKIAAGAASFATRLPRYGQGLHPDERRDLSARFVLSL